MCIYIYIFSSSIFETSLFLKIFVFLGQRHLSPCVVDTFIFLDIQLLELFIPSPTLVSRHLTTGVIKSNSQLVQDTLFWCFNAALG